MARIAKRTADETKRAIQEAFIELYKEEHLEKVTVGAISAKANVNRGTFYRYYQDVYDLLGQLEDQYIEKISHIVPFL